MIRDTCVLNRRPTAAGAHHPNVFILRVGAEHSLESLHLCAGGIRLVRPIPAVAHDEDLLTKLMLAALGRGQVEPDVHLWVFLDALVSRKGIGIPAEEHSDAQEAELARGARFRRRLLLLERVLGLSVSALQLVLRCRQQAWVNLRVIARCVNRHLQPLDVHEGDGRRESRLQADDCKLSSGGCRRSA